MKQDNRGISLVEIVIVVTIMIIVGGGMMLAISTVTGRPAQKCAQKITYSLDRHRTTAMGKKDASYTLSVDGNGQIIAQETINGVAGNVIPVGERGVEVAYYVGGSRRELSSGALTLSFARGSGAFNTISGGGYCTKIEVSKAGKVFNVELVPLTGKVYIK